MLRNLELCFPELSADERVDLAKRHFRSLIRSFLERTYPFHAPPDLIEKIVTLDGAEFIDEVLDRPVILFTPHFAGIDIGVMRLSMCGRAFVSSYKKKKNPIIESWRIAGRSRFNKGVLVPREAGIRAFIREIKPGAPACFLPDMDIGRRGSVFVPFFGIPAATATSLSRLAKVTGAAIVPVVVEQNESGYIVHVHKAWENFPTDDAVADAARMNRFIEAEIRKRPEQYYWFHRRFKTRPKKQPSLY